MSHSAACLVCHPPRSIGALMQTHFSVCDHHRRAHQIMLYCLHCQRYEQIDTLQADMITGTRTYTSDPLSTKGTVIVSSAWCYECFSLGTRHNDENITYALKVVTPSIFKESSQRFRVPMVFH